MEEVRPPVREARGASALEVLGAAVVLLVLLAVFLWTPLTSSGTAYSSDDLLQSSPLVKTVPLDYRYGNVAMTDPVLQMHPWLEWNKEHLADGDLPVWNPYNGAGTPHLANFVSAVLSPFSVPFYVMPWRAALLVAAGLKLFVLGLFTYLFLRKVAVSHLAGLVGAAGFMFAAYNVLWLAWPHPGAVICLPAGLYFAEVAMQAGSRVRQRLAWCGYAVAVLFAFLAGHPETLFFSWGLVLAYVPLRLLVGRDLGGGRERLAKAGQFVIASVLAVGMAAVQVLPFVEYLHRSTAYAEGSERAQAHFSLAYSGLHAFPNLFGAPSQTYYQPLQLLGGLQLPDGTRLQSNYIESNGFYVGLLVLLLAGVGVVSLLRRRQPGTTFLGLISVVAALGWVVYAHDLGGIGHTIGKLPLVELSAINRSHPIWAFSACCLAAVGVDALLRAGTGRRRWATGAAVAAGGVILLAVGVLLARHTLDAGGNLGGRVLDPVGKPSVEAHLRYVAFTFLAGVAVLVALVGFGSRGRWVRAVAGLTVVGVVFAQGGWLLRSHNPTIDDDLVFADSPGLDAVAAAAGPLEETVSFGPLLSADSNLWYRLRSPETYDGVGLRRYDQLVADLAALPAPIRGARTLEVLGVRYIASDGAYPGALPAVPRLPAPMTFVANLNGLQAFTVLTSLPPAGSAAGTCQVTLSLVETASGTVAAEATAPCRRPFTTLTIPPIAASGGKSYTATFGGPVQVLAFAPWAQGPALEQVDGTDSIALFRAPASPARYFSPAEARPVASDDEARRLLAGPDFAMSKTVLVNGLVAASSGTEGQVEVLEQRATEVRLRVTRADPGWLVAIQTSYPGWTATVDGEKAKVERADFAFTAVAVGAGTHDVVLRYRPRSVRYGAIVTGEAVVLMIVWLATARRRAPRARRARIPWDPTKAPPPPDPEADPDPSVERPERWEPAEWPT